MSAVEERAPGHQPPEQSAPRYDPAFKDEVRRRTDLAELIGREVALRRRGWDFWGCCPFHGERTASFKVSIRDGFYKCFGCGAGGDAFTWLMERHGMGFRDALEDLAIRAGLQPDRQGRTRPKAKPVALPAAESEAERRAHAATRIAKARAIWQSAHPVAGSLVETYLASRGIDPARIPGWPIPTLRFLPMHGYWLPPDRKDDPPIHLGDFPVMVAYVQSPDGTFAGVHRTWLARAGRGKARLGHPDANAKKMLGLPYGGYLRLCRAEREMMVAEGIETTLSLIVATGQAGWAALSEGNLGAALPPVVRHVTVCADNDTKDKATTDNRLASAVASHAARGCRTRIARPPEGMDFNDLLRGEG